MQERTVDMHPPGRLVDETAQAKAVNSPRHAQLTQLAADIAGSARMTAQRRQLAQLRGVSTPMSGQFDGIQLKGLHKKKPVQKMAASIQFNAGRKKKPVQKHAASSPIQSMMSAPENRTGLPSQLKQGVEALSGMSMDHVRVHYNSSKPSQLQAHAYAQGADIHVASGQERHLPHEAWHVVQQAQGRVKPTMQMKGTVPINDDRKLESEADVMGARASQLGTAMGR